LEKSSSNVGGVIDGGVLRVTTLETTRLTFMLPGQVVS
jgi:hypothetical protein